MDDFKNTVYAWVLYTNEDTFRKVSKDNRGKELAAHMNDIKFLSFKIHNRINSYSTDVNDIKQPLRDVLTEIMSQSWVGSENAQEIKRNQELIDRVFELYSNNDNKKEVRLELKDFYTNLKKGPIANFEKSYPQMNKLLTVIAQKVVAYNKNVSIHVASLTFLSNYTRSSNGLSTDKAEIKAALYTLLQKMRPIKRNPRKAGKVAAILKSQSAIKRILTNYKSSKQKLLKSELKKISAILSQDPKIDLSTQTDRITNIDQLLTDIAQQVADYNQKQQTQKPVRIKFSEPKIKSYHKPTHTMAVKILWPLSRG